VSIFLFEFVGIVHVDKAGTHSSAIVECSAPAWGVIEVFLKVLAQIRITSGFMLEGTITVLGGSCLGLYREF